MTRPRITLIFLLLSAVSLIACKNEAPETRAEVQLRESNIQFEADVYDPDADYGVPLNFQETEELPDIDLGFLDEPDLQVVSADVDSKSRIYAAWQVFNETLQTYSGVSVISSSGDSLFTISGNYNIRGVVITDDDTPLVLLGDSMSSTLKVIDVENEAWDETIELPVWFRRVFSGTGGAIFFDSGLALYRYDINENILTKLFEYSQLGIFGAVMRITHIEENRFLLSVSGGDVLYVRPMSGHIVSNENGEGGYIESDTKNVLSLVYSSEIDPLVGAAIMDFNRNNDDYRIEMRSISPTDIPVLLTEIAIGQVPDIMLFGDPWCPLRIGIPPHRLAARGFLADLYTFLDEDFELGRESFLPNILYAISEGDSLYELPYWFTIDVAVGDAGLLGTKMGWTFDEMLALFDRLNFDGFILGPTILQESLLYNMLTFLIDDFIDWSTGTAYFDTHEFRRLLEIVKIYAPVDYSHLGDIISEKEWIAQRQQLMSWQTLSRPNVMQLFDFYFINAVPIGFPVRDGVGNSMRFDNSFAISSTTEHPEVAWSFIREFYMPDIIDLKDSSTWFRIPMNIEAIETWYIVDDPGITIAFGDDVIEMGPATAHDIERTRNILESVTRVSRLDRDISFIISEETDSYFRGVRDVENTARVI
ncbi:MAG: hypothetical protein FWE83_10100 [Oscillospiraceae bacterium]|nr:hypothetical protein [Oscillospiraceae bacterium]